MLKLASTTVSTLEFVLVTAARIAKPETTQVLHIQKKTNLQIEQLVHEKRRLRREWQFYRSPSARQSLKDATRKVTKALKQEEAYAQRRYIEKLSTYCKKHSLWRAHPTLSSPTETMMPI